MSGYVYIVRCCDGTLYTGATTDVSSRVNRHNEGLGAKYTKGRTPVSLVFCLECDDYHNAQSYEWYIKHLTKKKKLLLIQKYNDKVSPEILKEFIVSETK